jgi:hypothetical protein
MPRFDDDETKAESKYEGKEADSGDSKDVEEEDEWALPGMGQAEEDTLLSKAAKYCNADEFQGEMTKFIARNSAAWETADVKGTGEGSSHEQLAAWRGIHEVTLICSRLLVSGLSYLCVFFQEYLELFEFNFEAFVKREGGSLAELMEDCRVALENKVSSSSMLVRKMPPRCHPHLLICVLLPPPPPLQYAWLFEDENYAAFVTWMKSVLDFEHFHATMTKEARKLVEERASHK